MKRRMVTLGLGAMGAAPLLMAATTRVAAVPATLGEAPPLEFPAGEPVPSLEALLERELAMTGTETPYPAEVERGLSILLEAPTATTPFLVAGYFLRLNEGEYGMENALYAREWSERANPVIVSFFDATTYRTPEGDTTHWCAAFVCWCIAQARLNKSDTSTLIDSPKSAASKQFRTWGEKTENPVVGDIAVFVNASDSTRGHVGFYVGQIGDDILVLGGNQRTVGRFTTGEVTVSTYKRNGDPYFHSFRTHPTLHHR